MKHGDSSEVLSELSSEQASVDCLRQLGVDHPSSERTYNTYYFSSEAPPPLSESQLKFINKWVQEIGQNLHCEKAVDKSITCEACRDFGIMKFFHHNIAISDCNAYPIEKNMSDEHRKIVDLKFETIKSHISMMLQPLGFSQIDFVFYEKDSWQVPMICYVPKDKSTDLPWFGECDVKGRPMIIQFKANRASGQTLHPLRGMIFPISSTYATKMLMSALKCRRHNCIRNIYGVSDHRMDIEGVTHEFELLLTAPPSFSLKAFLDEIILFGVMRCLREIFGQLIDFLNCLHMDSTRKFYL